MYALQCKHFVDPVVLRTLNGATHQMPTPVGHSLAGLAVHLTGRPLDRRNTHALLGLVALANAPDLDLVPGYLFGNPGAYHWGPTHSFAAAILAGTLVGILARRYGFEKEAEEIQDLYLDGKKDEAAAKVPTELLELTNLCGPESFVAERIAAYREAGVTNLNVIPLGGDPADLIARVKDLSA